MVRLAILLVLTTAGLAGADSPLNLSQVSVHQFDGGPALPRDHEFFPGEMVFLVMNVTGFKTNEDAKIDMAYEIQGFDPDGKPLAPAVSNPIATELAPQDKKWLPKIRWEVLVPSTAPSGDYKVKVKLTDQIAKTQAEREATFRVRGRAIESSDTLTLRDFRFYRGEEESNPLKQASYRPGDQVWGRFEIVGYKFAPKNGLDVEYGVRVNGSDGKVFFDAPQAAVQREESYYPKRFVSGVLNLNLGKDMQPGEFTITVSLRDNIGKQTAESQQVFRIE
jgi:hypothetical protein